MILKDRLHNPDALISIGMACLAIGIVAQRFIHPAADFWQGFVAGVSGVLIGSSIVLNLRGLSLRRKHRENGS
jgi:hypothetical protein